MYVVSEDRSRIHVEISGAGNTALLFAHGWMGNLRWWDAQRDALAENYQIITLDLAGHGASDSRAVPSAEGYAADIVAAASISNAKRVVLVGHSMSGMWVLLAAPHVERLTRIILVDTLKNLDQLPTLAQAEPMLASYRASYEAAVRTVLPQYLFTAQTPPAVVERLTREFLSTTGDIASDLLLPLYKSDPRGAARATRVPVRGIGGDGGADNAAYFADYRYTTLPGCGHYPMLERPDEFRAALLDNL